MRPTRKKLKFDEDSVNKLLQEIYDDSHNQRAKIVRLFTKWETKIKENNDNINKLLNKVYYNISTRQYSDVEKLVKENKIIKGKPDEIFKELRVKLNEMINQKVPESIIKLSNEYKDLEAGLK